MTNLGYALLGLLAREPASGYDLTSQMRAPVGFLWRARHSQIYPQLARLEAEGLITPGVVEQVVLPAKKVYTITPGGLAQLPSWFTNPAEPPAIRDEAGGRLHQEFAMDGQATLRVPPGRHRVLVSRGYEWEMHDVEVDVAAGETVDVAAPIHHSVDTTGVMCADFHIHSFFSADSNDPADHKVKGAIADGLDIPVSSEHEWVIDFQPIVESLGLERWALGMASQELTTFTWGHFGVVPATPVPGGFNNGGGDGGAGVVRRARPGRRRRSVPAQIGRAHV